VVVVDSVTNDNGIRVNSKDEKSRKQGVAAVYGNEHKLGNNKAENFLEEARVCRSRIELPENRGGIEMEESHVKEANISTSVNDRECPANGRCSQTEPTVVQSAASGGVSSSVERYRCRYVHSKSLKRLKPTDEVYVNSCAVRGRLRTNESIEWNKQTSQRWGKCG